jgi:hypothetical protein
MARQASVAAIAATQLGAPTAGAAGLEIPRIEAPACMGIIFIAVGGRYASAMIVEVAGEAPAVAKMTAGETATSECVMGEAHAAECEERGDGCNFDERSLHDDCISLMWLLRISLPLHTPGPDRFGRDTSVTQSPTADK